MKYPIFSTSNVIDVTKPPYNADNTGKTDCTKVLQQAINDCLQGYIDALCAMREKLLELYKKQGGNIYLGAEAGRVIDGKVYMTAPKEVPPVKIIYFPNGEYLVSDTVCYTFDDLVAPQLPGYDCELCRNVHLLGESKEKTVIRLADHSKGFEKGTGKPVISFNRKSTEDKETTNCAQLNTLEDITVDCGQGNEGAIGVLYASSNCGRIENVRIQGCGLYGILYDYGSEGCFNDIEIIGFDYGIKTGHTSPCVFDNIELSKNKIAGVLSKNGNLNFQKANFGELPALQLKKSENGRYYFTDRSVTVIGEMEGNSIYFEKENPFLNSQSIPKNERSQNFDDWVCVDAFGAIGDGKTDSTTAIQKAMNSGKSVILFGQGTYVINRTVKIPASVQTVDFMYASIQIGYSLLIGEMEGLFDICEDSEKPFFAEHFSPGEDFSGFFRMFKHSSQRTVVLKDLGIAASLYFNTVGGSDVYFDNCFTHTNHYAQDAGLHRDGYVPVFCKVIPVELHSQKAYGRNLNIERGEVELLNDASELMIDGYKVEGPGELVKTVNGGKTQLNLFNAAWWGNKIEDNAIFEIHNSEIDVTGGNIFCYPENDRYCTAFLVDNDKNKRIS
ncbi:MAG: hypothetical protein IJA86_00990, partial [Clostridia bacterium]|nr:hypothetical protein [Clostridia bacterium]